MYCRAILSSPVYAIDAKNDLNKYLHGHGFRNVQKVKMIPRTKLNGFCEFSKLKAHMKEKEPSARLFHVDTEVKAARAVCSATSFVVPNIIGKLLVSERSRYC